VAGEVLHQLAVAFDRDPLGHQILPDHRFQRVADAVFGVRPPAQRVRIEFGRATQLDDAPGEQVRMAEFLVGMRQEFLRDRFRVDALGHEGVLPVAQGADQFGGERVVQQLGGRLGVETVVAGHRAFLDVFARPRPQGFDIGQKSGVRLAGGRPANRSG